MPQTSVTVPIRGDNTYKKALKALAYQKGLTMAELVRQAVDQNHSAELRPHLDFFGSNGCKNTQPDTSTN